jgi:hypothetical protein
MSLLVLMVALLLPGATPRAAAQQTACVNGPCLTPHRLYLPVLMRRYPAPETAFGVQMYGRLDTPAAALELAGAGNVSWVRTQISWIQVEPVNVTPDKYNFAAYDNSMLSATRKGIRPIATILDNPKWAATYLNGPIDKTSLEEFGQFVGAAVERYDGDGYLDAPGSPVVRYYEFYNEPDSGDEIRASYGQAFWGDYGAEYAEMLCVARWHARQASDKAQIVFGGVAHDWFRADGGPFVESFVDDVLLGGGGKCMDVMNFHYYPVFAGRWQAYGNGIIGKAEYFRQKLAGYGLDKPMMCTEAGWHSDAQNQYPSSPQMQAEFALKLFAQTRAANLISNIWWTWIDLDATVGSFGLLSQSLSPKPSYYAFQYAGSRLGAVRFGRTLSATELGAPTLEGYLFSGSTPLYVLWSNDTATRTVKLTGKSARVLDPFGAFVSSATDAQDGTVDGRVSVTIGPMPVYVEVVP